MEKINRYSMFLKSLFLLINSKWSCKSSDESVLGYEKSTLDSRVAHSNKLNEWLGIKWSYFSIKFDKFLKFKIFCNSNWIGYSQTEKFVAATRWCTPTLCGLAEELLSERLSKFNYS